MTTLVEDLKAARALIDTPEKLAEHGLVPAMLKGHTIAGFNAVRIALKSALPGTYDTVTAWSRDADHADIMALFDRAIAAASEPPHA